MGKEAASVGVVSHRLSVQWRLRRQSPSIINVVLDADFDKTNKHIEHHFYIVNQTSNYYKPDFQQDSKSPDADQMLISETLVSKIITFLSC